jgi:vancomycin permeability regulator SanA
MTVETSVAVVLGSGLRADGTATEVTALRAKAAAAFLKSRPMKLIASGSRAPNDSAEHGRTEAEVMAEIVVAEGVSGGDLLLEDQSFDTFGNAILTVSRHLKNLVPGTLFVVTSPFHMERALFIFKQVLGPKWAVVGQDAPEWEGETRQPGAPAALERARQFFDGIEPGDLDACLAKLIARIPAYAGRAVLSDA